MSDDPVDERQPATGDPESSAGEEARPRPDDAAPTRVTLSFPDLPRLELDQLLGQLVERAQEVMGTQGRLRTLLRANQLVTGDLALPAVLRRIVEAARELVGARHAALGVIGPGGGLAEFMHTDMPAEALERIEQLLVGTGGHGVAGSARSRRVLVMPIRVRGKVFGNLYLAESTRGGFTAEDLELTTALAATAGAAIQNARLYESARSRGEWLQASAAVTRELLTAETDDPTGHLQLIAERSRELADAEVVAVMLPLQQGSSEELIVDVSVGKGSEKLLGRRVPVARSLAGRAFSSGEPARVVRAADVPGWSASLAAELDVGPLLAAPLVGSRRVHGVLWAARRQGRPAFTAEDLDLAGSFANHAAVAIELAEARQEQQRAAMLDERERIASDLHDHVIQRLFAAGLSLQSVAGSMGPGPAGARLRTTIRDLDDTITQIRATIFALHTEPAPTDRGVRDRLLDVIAELTPALGFEPDLRFDGLREDKIPPRLVDDLVAVLREALTNVARHADAGIVQIDVTANADRITLEVCDDGRGIGEVPTAGGLASMRRRSADHSGHFAVVRAEPTGTRLTWSAPIG